MYTCRSIHDSTLLETFLNESHRVLKRKAKETGKSFNQVALEALASGAGESLKPKRDFSEVIGSLSEKEASKIEAEVRLQRQIDSKLWDS